MQSIYVCVFVQASACVASSLYVSGFSSDTRCRDLKIKSQSVCHLLTLLSLVFQPLNSSFLSLSPFSLFLWPFVGEWLLPCWLSAASRSSNRLLCVCETSLCEGARWLLMQPGVTQKYPEQTQIRTLYSNRHIRTICTCKHPICCLRNKLPLLAKCDLKSLNGK